MEQRNSPVIFFDGICVLCNGFVDFLLEKDKGKNLKFASLQGETAKKLLGASPRIDSIVFYEAGETFTRSTAVLKITKYLPAPIRYLSSLLIIPAPIRDFFYNVVAKNRYRWFGKRESCRLPTAEEAERILS